MIIQKETLNNLHFQHELQHNSICPLTNLPNLVKWNYLLHRIFQEHNRNVSSAKSKSF